MGRMIRAISENGGVLSFSCFKVALISTAPAIRRPRAADVTALVSTEKCHEWRS